MYLDSDNWIKGSIEYENEEFQHLGSVVTNNGYSDWATTEIDASIKSMWYRFSRREDDYCIECSTDHFLGGYAMSGKYDFQRDYDACYQGEFWSAGITYGYSMRLSRRFNLEFSISVGYLSTAYRHYFPADDYSELWRDHYDQGRKSYFGPTKAKIALVWPLQIPYKKKGGRR